MSITILIVDDEPRYLRLMEANLITENYQVLKAANGLDAVNIVKENHPDLVIMDVMMPVMDGFGACEEIREFSTVPIIIVTAKGSENDRVKGLNLGADDYIVKPFSATELVARVRAVLRRTQSLKTAVPQSTFTHGNLKIDLAHAEVYKGDKIVYLSATEYRLLLQLTQNLGNVLSSEQLLTEVWGAEYRDDKEILWVSISRLRQKLENDPKNPQHIVTRSGLGYTMPPL